MCDLHGVIGVLLAFHQRSKSLNKTGLLVFTLVAYNEAD